VAHGIIDAQAHGLAHVGLGQLEPERAEHLDLRLAPEGLRVDEQAAEIEDDRFDRKTGQGVG
jgi:hypothetical protein